ncbi:hypothetical protein R9X49_22100 [Pectobacterium carotovorum]|uniref:hypothetical protein n=1 Tax=Pectobacterium carotovorum TaxID=554 RepID=UPI0029D55A16|nr:hypothetical protein [Pectobacterium carotovorum]MDX6917792.1 hypothetical protein [Pectobacterium carotovorum]
MALNAVPAGAHSQTVHLITTCSKGKTAPAGDTVFPYDTLPIDEAMTFWRQQVQKAFATAGGVRPTAALYCGVHWGKAIALAQQFSELELWVISAGLGLRHSSDPAVPYEATFKDMSYPPAAVWEQLTQKPLLPGRCSSLAMLMRRHPADGFVIAGSPTYIQAIEQDVNAGIGTLTDAAAQLTIVTSQAYRGCLLPYVTCSSTEMLTTLSCNMTSLNISLAGTLIAPHVDELRQRPL